MAKKIFYHQTYGDIVVDWIFRHKNLPPPISREDAIRYLMQVCGMEGIQARNHIRELEKKAKE